MIYLQRSSEKTAGPRSVLPLLVTQTVAGLGNQVFALAVVWLLMGLTHTAGTLGVYYAVVELPYLLFLIPAGLWADSGRRKVIAGVVLFLRTVVTGVIVVVARMHGVGWIPIVGLVVLQESAGAVMQPSLGAWLMGIVAPEDFGTVTSWRQMGAHVASLLGPGVGGLLIGVIGLDNTLAVALVTGLIGLGGLLATRRPERERAAPPSRPRFGDGWHFLVQHPGMLRMVLYFAATNGLNDVEAVLVPVLSRFVLHLSSWQFGALSTAFGLGALAGSWWALRADRSYKRRANPISGVLWAMGGFGAAIGVMGLAPNGWVLAGAYVAAGVSFAWSEVVTSTLWQRTVPDAERGRVMSTLSTLARSANPLGYLAAGWLGAVWGPRQGLLVGSVAIVALTMAMGWSPAVRALGSEGHDASARA